MYEPPASRLPLCHVLWSQRACPQAARIVNQGVVVRIALCGVPALFGVSDHP